MPNGNQQKQYLFQDWGWSLPDSASGKQQETPIEEPQLEPPQYAYQNWGWDLPNKPQPVDKVESENKKIEELHEPVRQAGGSVGGILSNFAMDKDIITSEYKMLKRAASEGDQEAQASIEALDSAIKRKGSFGEGAQYAMKRAASFIPGISLIPGSAEYIDWQKHRVNPLELQRATDKESPEYDPLSKQFPIGFGAKVGIHDMTDLATTVGEFMIIGGITKIPFQAALKASKTGKLTSGAYRLFTKNKKMIPVLKHVAKSNVDFGIHNFTTMHEEDLAENSTFGSKVRARFEKIPSTIVTASLFGSLGSFKNVYAQYGGVFTAGYTTAMLEATKAGLPVSEAHKQAYKSGMMLVGVHGTNALGMKAGKEYMKKYAKDKGMSEQSAQALAEQIVQKKIDEKKPIFKSALKEPSVVEIVGETKLANNQKAFIVKDVQEDSPSPKPIRVNDFYKHYEQTNHPKIAETIRKGRLGKIHTLQDKLKMSDVDQYVYKRQVMNPKGKIPDIKQGELPFYVDIESKTAGELKVIADQFGLKYKITDNKATMLGLIENNVPKAKGEYLSWADANPRQLYEARAELDKRYQIERIKSDREKGLYVTSLNDDGNKVFKKSTFFKGKPTDTEVHTERIITDLEGAIERGLLDTQNKVKELNTIYIQEEVTPAMSKRVIKAKAGELDPTNLSPIETKLLEIYTKQMEQGAIVGKGDGTLREIIDNYWTGMFPDASAKQIQSIKAKSLSVGSTPYSKEKLYLLPSEAEAAGLKPVYDLRELTGHWWDSINKATAYKTLYERLGNLPTINGNIAVTGEKVPGYFSIDYAPHLSRAITGSYRKKVYIHPELYEPMSILFNPKVNERAVTRALIRLNNGVKRIIMINPLIHGWNIYSDVMDEYNFRLMKTGRVVLAGEKSRLLAKRMGYVEGKAEWNALSKEKQAKLNDEMLMEMAGQGIGIAETRALSTEFDNFYKKHYSELSVSDANFNKKLKNMGTRFRKAPLKTLRMASDNFLWDKIVKNSQISIYALTKSRARKAGLSEVASKRVAGHYTKDLLGMLPKSVFASSGLGGSRFLSFLFFARNWTISNMRLISGAMGYRGKNLPRFLSHKGLSQKDMKFLQEQYSSHVIKGVLGTIISINMLNYAFTGIKEVLDETGKLIGYTWDKAKAHWATDNETGHEMDIDTGTYNRKGGKVYVENLIFRYIKDYFNWYGDPVRTFLNKVHPLPKAAIEQIINMTLWNQRKIIRYPDQITMAEKAKKRTKHLLYSVTPYGQFVGQPNRLRTNIEKIAPLFGTWIKSGVPGGEFADKINKFIDKKKYELDEIDKQIDLIAQTGDMSHVINELIEKKRFKTIDGIRDRLQKYKNPLLYKYLIVLRSKSDKAEFLKTLTAKEREEFFGALKVGNPNLKIEKP